MSYQQMQFIATIIIQLVVGGFVLGKSWQIIKNHSEILREHKGKLDEYGTTLRKHEGKISRIEGFLKLNDKL